MKMYLKKENLIKYFKTIFKMIRISIDCNLEF